MLETTYLSENKQTLARLKIVPYKLFIYKSYLIYINWYSIDWIWF